MSCGNAPPSKSIDDELRIAIGHVPQNAAEWSQLLEGTGIAPPDHVWTFQESDEADLNGDIIAVSAVDYQDGVTGWVTKKTSR